VKDKQTEGKTTERVCNTKQGGEIYNGGRGGTEVSTEPMLKALKKARGGKWFSLIDKVSSKKALRASYKKVRGNGERREPTNREG
jgi:hypothetical protein